MSRRRRCVRQKQRVLKGAVNVQRRDVIVKVRRGEIAQEEACVKRALMKIVTAVVSAKEVIHGTGAVVNRTA
jgi:hypothetical protein